MILVGCAPKSETTEFSDLPKKQYEYTPRNEDRELVTPASELFNFESVVGLEKSKNNQSPWISDSVGIFKLAENSMEMGDLFSGTERTEYKKFGHDLLKLFYQSKENTTQFDKTQTMYLPAALGFEGRKIKSLFNEIATPENVKKVEQVFANHQIEWPAEKPNLKPAEFVRSIKNYLLETSELFKKNGVSASFVNTFAVQVDKDYIQALNKGEARLKDTDQNTKLKYNAVLIREVIQSLSFIPQDAVKDLLQNLVKAKEYADLIEPKHPSGLSQTEREIKVIAGIWLDLTPAQREKYIKPANEMLYTKLSDFPEKLIKWFAGRDELGFGDFEIGWGLLYKRGFINGLETSCHIDAYADLNLWLKMNDAQKSALKEKKPDIFAVFSRYTNTEITDNILPEYSDNEFKKSYTGGLINRFRSDLTPVCITRIQHLLDRSINLYLLTELDQQIRNWGGLIGNIVHDKTMENLTSIAGAVGSEDKFTEYFSKMAYPIMGNMLFEGEGTLSALENSRIQLMVNARDQLTTKREVYSQFDTGAETLGVSLAAQYRRILELPEFEKKAPNSKDYYRVVFSQVNKMLSMIGFRTMDNKLVPSLHRNFYGTRTELDVYKYECSPEKTEKQQAKKDRYNEDLREKKTPSPDDYVDIREDCKGYEDYIKNMYQIPDQMVIFGSFSPGSYKKYSSIRAQAEVIRGGSLMLNYFNDWRGPNDFDTGLGKETFSEIEVFPKHAFVNLAVAVSTAPIRGLQRVNSPLKLFNSRGQEMQDWTQKGIPDFENPDPNMSAEEKADNQIIQAAIASLLENGPSKIIKIEDMAYFIVAIDEFLNATRGIENTQASVINPPDKKIKENMDMILKGRKLLRMMMFAMSNFMVSRMQDPDGGFWAQYELNKSGTGSILKDQPRSLEVQLSAIKALLAVYRNWGSEGALVSAVESYYFMNQRLWNPITSFYKVNENSNGTEVKPYVFMDAVMNFRRIAPYLNNANSQAQAQRMFDYYSKEFLKWNESAKPMLTTLN